MVRRIKTLVKGIMMFFSWPAGGRMIMNCHVAFLSSRVWLLTTLCYRGRHACEILISCW